MDEQIVKKEISRVLNNFLKNWVKTNTKRMLAYCTKTWKSYHKHQDFAGTNLNTFKIKEITINECVADVTVELNDSLFTCRLVKEKVPYKGDIDGFWGVNPISFKPIR